MLPFYLTAYIFIAPFHIQIIPEAAASILVLFLRMKHLQESNFIRERRDFSFAKRISTKTTCSSGDG